MLKKSKMQVIKKDIMMADIGSCFSFILTYAGSLCLFLLCQQDPYVFSYYVQQSTIVWYSGPYILGIFVNID